VASLAVVDVSAQRLVTTDSATESTTDADSIHAACASGAISGRSVLLSRASGCSIHRLVLLPGLLSA
jgi:hypothetical protein